MYDIVYSMTRQKIQSSMIKSAGHNNNTLEIEFTGGSIYQYKEISSRQYKDMIQADSPGKYFTANIRPKYKGIKL